MPQRPKIHMREALLAAAASEFSELGFERTTLASVAARAQTSVGNLYKYFANKDELFHAVISPQLVEAINQLLRNRVEALGATRDVGTLPATHPYRLASDELLRFSLAHRAELLFLLLRAQDTAYASFAEDVAQHLVKLALRYATEAYPDVTISARRRRTLVRIYRALLTSLGSMLAEERSEQALRDAIALYNLHHLSGLRALFEDAENERSEP